jgi:hypothetical protein
MLKQDWHNDLASGGGPLRPGAGRVLQTRAEPTSEISLPRDARSRELLKVAVVECRICHQITERRSPVQRYSLDCSDELRRMRSQRAMERRRSGP